MDFTSLQLKKNEFLMNLYQGSKYIDLSFKQLVIAQKDIYDRYKVPLNWQQCLSLPSNKIQNPYCWCDKKMILRATWLTQKTKP